MAGTRDRAARKGRRPRWRPLRWVRAAVRSFRSADDSPTLPDPPTPAELIQLLRLLGMALCDSGDASSNVAEELQELADRYGATGVRFMVLPTGVFVRIGGPDGLATVDFLPAGNDALRLDQIGALHDLIEDLKKNAPPPQQAKDRLEKILASPPRFGPWTRSFGHVVLILGLGLALNPAPRALVGYAVLGVGVALLVQLAGRFQLLSLALPVTAAMLVTVTAFKFAGPLAGGNARQLLLPPLVTFLPGAALTMGTIELATGAIVSGASRMIYGFNVLFLLAFGILAGTQLAHAADQPLTTSELGWWAPVLGTLLVGAGHYLRSCAPRGSFGWLMVVLLAVFAAQTAGTLVASALVGAFLGGLVLTPAAYAVQVRRQGPPAQVAFLPAFWMLVPGGMGLTGASELVVLGVYEGVAEVVQALLTVIAIALGMLVGSSLTQSATRFSAFTPPR